MMKQTVEVDGMTCAGCANSVRLKFSALPNVEAVDMDLENKQAHLTTKEEISSDDLSAALEGTSYSVVK